MRISGRAAAFFSAFFLLGNVDQVELSEQDRERRKRQAQLESSQRASTWGPLPTSTWCAVVGKEQSGAKLSSPLSLLFGTRSAHAQIALGEPEPNVVESEMAYEPGHSRSANAEAAATSTTIAQGVQGIELPGASGIPGNPVTLASVEGVLPQWSPSFEPGSRSIPEIWLLLLTGVGIVLFVRFVPATSDAAREYRLRVMCEYRLLTLQRQNVELAAHVEQAVYFASKERENVMRSVGADLHDGPAQLLALALLRLDTVRSAFSKSRSSLGDDDLEAIQAMVLDALKDVRNICSGLSMPDVNSLSLADAIEHIIDSHSKRTQTSVLRELRDLPHGVKTKTKVCICRLVQEGLNNAFRHAGGVGQRVAAIVESGRIIVEVQDQGIAAPKCKYDLDGRQLGTSGLRRRVESLGGHLDLISLPGTGTILRAELPLSRGSIYDHDTRCHS